MVTECSNQYLHLRKVAILFQFIDALDFINCFFFFFFFFWGGGGGGGGGGGVAKTPNILPG